MKGLLSVTKWFFVATYAVSILPAAGPGDLLGSGYRSIQELAQTRPALRLPANLPRSTMFECRYQPMASGGTSPEVRYFWTDQPDWLASLPADHPVRQLVKRPVGHCPDTLAEADQTKEQLGPLWPPDDAKKIMGGLHGGAVFAAVLDTRAILGGKWTRLQTFKNVNDKTPAIVTFRLLTDTDVIDMTPAGLVVRPVTYRGKTFCYNDPKRTKEVCEELLLKDWSMLAIGEAREKDFDMYATIEILKGPPPGAPSPAQIAEARNATSHGDARVSERRADDGFTTLGLKNAQALLNIHDGKFAEVTIPRDSVYFEEFVLQYLLVFGGRCQQQLPPNHVPMKKAECAHSRESYNSLNTRTGVSCLDYKDVNIGVEADPRLYEISKKLTQDAAMAQLSKAVNTRTGVSGGSPSAPLVDAFKNLQSIVDDERTAKEEINGMLDRNGCGSAGMARFQENMARYATGDMPVLTSGQVQKSPGQLASEQFDANCAARIATIIPPASAKSCPCLHSLLESQLSKEQVNDLANDFTRERFLLAAVGKTGLAGKVRACIQ